MTDDETALAYKQADQIITSLRSIPPPTLNSGAVVDWHYRFRDPHKNARWGDWKRMNGTIEENRKLFSGKIIGEPNRDETKIAVEFRPLFALSPNKDDTK